MALKISIGNKNEEDPKNIEIKKKTPEKPASEPVKEPEPVQPSPPPQNEGFQRNNVPKIDMDAIKSELMKTLEEENERKRKAREKEIRKREEELKKVEAELQEEKENISNNKKFRRKSKMLAKNSPEGNADFFTNYQIRLRNQRMRAITFTISFYLVIGLILACNFYFIFLKKETPMKTIEQTVKTNLRVYMFPTDGVQEYLEKNLPELMQEDVNVTGGSGAGSWNIQEVRIRKFNIINDSLANVYFSIDVSTATGTAEHNYIMALKYDYTNKVYLPASCLVARNTSYVDSAALNDADDIVWGFGENKPSKDVEKLQEFLNQYFIMLYNNKTVPSASLKLSGDVVFDNEEFTFEFIDEVEYYPTVVNYMGANCKVTYSVKSIEGLTYSITTYMTVEEDGDGSYKITTLY